MSFDFAGKHCNYELVMKCTDYTLESGNKRILDWLNKLSKEHVSDDLVNITFRLKRWFEDVLKQLQAKWNPDHNGAFTIEAWCDNDSPQSNPHTNWRYQTKYTEY